MNEAKPSVPAPPPPPPPPPILLPPPPPQQEPKLVPRSLNTSVLTKVDENKLELALSRLVPSEGSSKIFYKCNTFATPQLQDGPKCGLVALSIATSTGENVVSVDDIFQTAISKGLTKQGEMFSANALASLAEICCGFKTRVIHGSLNSHLNCIIKSLLRKCLLLVPYDADFNHGPCCKKGTKAHWAVITGLAIITKGSSKNNPEDENFIKINSCSAPCNCPNSNLDTPLSISFQQGAVIIGKVSKKTLNGDLQEGKIYLIGLQGKSQHVGLWDFQEMSNSNDNLFVFSTNRDSNLYLLPEGGVDEGLRGKAIILDH